MRLLLTFLFLVTLLMPTASRAGLANETVSGTETVVSFYVTVNPTVSVATVQYNETHRKLVSVPQPAPLDVQAEKKTKLFLGALALFLAVVGLWSAVKNFMITFVSSQREGFGLKVVSGTIMFIVSLAILFYSLELMKESM